MLRTKPKNRRRPAVWAPQERVALVERASTIEERLGPDYALASGDDEDPDSQRRLDRWRHVIAKGDDVSFDRSLDWQGLNPSTVLRALRPPRWSSRRPLPGWPSVIEDVIRAADHECTDEAASFADADRPVDFPAFYAPFVHVARARLQRECARAGVIQGLSIEPSVWTQLEHALVRSMAFLSGPTLALEFEIFKAHAAMPLLFGASLDGQHARAFVRTFSAARLQSFLTEYCVLARQLATLLVRWSRVGAEFFARLAADRQAIHERFHPDRELGALSGLEVGLSDPHNGGRSVFRLTFSSGMRLIYKPRPVSADVAFYALLDWFNAQHTPVPFRIVTYLDRGAYGWVEHVDYIPSNDWDALRAYARGAGATLCVAYLLQSTDLHDGNLIAAEGGPVLIDLETLLAPHLQVHDSAEGAARDRAEEHLLDSVIRTAMLPAWRFGPNQDAADVGGLGDLCGPKSWNWYQRSDQANPIGAALLPQFERGAGSANGPMHGLIEDVVDGFSRTYEVARVNRLRLLEPGSPLEKFRRLPVRFLLRDTNIYLGILRRSLAPERLRDGADWSIELESVKRVLHLRSSPPSFVPLLQEEVSSMAGLNVPYFATTANRRSLRLRSGREVRQFFVRPSYGQVRARVRRLDQRELDAQVALIRAAFHVRHAGRPHEESGVASQVRSGRPRGVPSDPEREVLAIAEAINTRAFRGRDGSAAWIDIVPLHDAGCFQLATAPPDFLAGSSGVAVFLAALGQTIGTTRFRELARGALRSLVTVDGGSGSDAILATASLRAHVGRAPTLGLTLYGLVKAGQLLNDVEWIDLALRLSSTVGDDSIADRRDAGLRHGTAGTIIGLLSLAPHDPVGSALDRARQCGRHLLAQRLPGSQTGTGRAVNPVGYGMATGLSGIACAFARLAEQTGEAEFRDAAVEVLRSARRMIETAGMESERSSDRSTGGSWCSGIIGAGLAHIRCSDFVPAPDAAAVIESAVRVALETPAGGLDGLCCGTFGRVEFLLEAGRRLDRPELADAARRLARQAMAEAAASDGYSLYPGMPRSLFSPSLFYGQAGIGYTLLRLLDPRLPSVLLFE